MCVARALKAALHLTSPFFLLIWKTGFAFSSKGTVFSMSSDMPPLVWLAGKWFIGWEANRLLQADNSIKVYLCPKNVTSLMD